jgi:hypothetical protein
MSEVKPWVRQHSESPKAYEAFRAYLLQGATRSLARVEAELGKSHQLISKWSAQWNWVERCRAYDVYALEAQTDGVIHQLTEARDKNLELMDKLRGHLSNRLDKFIDRDQDPTMAWTNALTAMAKVEANWIMLKDDSKTDTRIGRIEELVERALREEPV